MTAIGSKAHRLEVQNYGNKIRLQRFQNLKKRN
jgi:hypothetical protein